MYTDFRKKKANISIDVVGQICSCGGCPTTFDFYDSEGTEYYFRLRHGSARIVCEGNKEVLLQESMDGFDGVCSWDEVIDWARKHGVMITMMDSGSLIQFKEYERETLDFGVQYTIKTEYDSFYFKSYCGTVSLSNEFGEMFSVPDIYSFDAMDWEDVVNIAKENGVIIIKADES